MSSSIPPVRLKIMLLVCTVALLALSLTQPGIYIDHENAWPSIIMFSMGWFGLCYSDPTYLFWLANPLLLISWVLLFRKIRVAAVFSLAAAVLAFSFLFCTSIVSDEAGHYHKITGHGPGYWLWLSSMVVFALGSALIAFINTDQTG